MLKLCNCFYDWFSSLRVCTFSDFFLSIFLQLLDWKPATQPTMILPTPRVPPKMAFNLWCVNQLWLFLFGLKIVFITNAALYLSIYNFYFTHIWQNLGNLIFPHFLCKKGVVSLISNSFFGHITYQIATSRIFWQSQDCRWGVT